MDNLHNIHDYSQNNERSSVIPSGLAEDACLDWDDAIENDGDGFVLLPAGDYVFQVLDIERGRHPGSEKVPPCNKAALTLLVKAPERDVRVRTDLLLYRPLEWKLSSFFRSIGQKQKGQALVMNWEHVPGSWGRARFGPRKYTAADGSERSTNDVVRYLDYDPEKMAAVSEASRSVACGNGFAELEGGPEDLPF